MVATFELPEITAAQHGKTYFSHPPKEIEHFVTIPESYHGFLKFIREHYNIEPDITCAITAVQHQGYQNLPKSSPGTSLRVLAHQGEVSMFKGLIDINKDPETSTAQLRFTLKNDENIILIPEQCQNLRFSIRSIEPGIRTLWVVDFGYRQKVDKNIILPPIK